MNFSPCETCGQHPTPIYLRIEEVGAKLKVHPLVIYRWMKTLNFPAPVKWGHASRWREDKVHQWMREQEEKQERQAS